MIGTRLAHYEITAHLGSGGMGDVFQAKDLKLGRSVAVKFLSEAFASDSDRVSRFEREARVLASLNHSNIAAIYGLEESNGRKFLVMELVPGETLADRIRRGPIPFYEALGIAKQICEALEAAHEKGIIHRDLKPANIKVTADGQVKVLDFGLAKALQEDTSNASLSDSPTMVSSAATNAGVILGTAAYMSPEQAKGRQVDERTDIFAFGCVLYEMLAGRRAFDGDDAGDILGAVLRIDPDWSRLPAGLPSSVRNLLRLCLEKNVKNRRRAVTDVRLDIEQALKEPPPEATAVQAPGRTHSPLAWIVAAAFLIGMAAVSAVHFREKPPAAPVLRSTIAAPENSKLHSFAVSPDGRYLVIAATVNGKRQLWLRALDALQPQPMAFTEDAAYPFWSPDSRNIGFFAQGKLKKVSANGGPAQALCDAPDARGGSWNHDDVIIFSPSASAISIQSVSAAGGVPSDVTKSKGDQRHPVFLPDGRHFLYFVRGAGEKSGIYVSSLDGMENRRILPDPSSPVFAPSPTGGRVGRILFVRETTLMAQPFDSASAQPAGDAFPVADGVTLTTEAAYLPVSVSDTGILLYEARGMTGSTNQIAWYDRGGKILNSVSAPGRVFDPAISPDEKSVVFRRDSSSSSDLWMQDLVRGTEARLTNNGSRNAAPFWSPKGDRVVFASPRNGFNNFFQKAASGSGMEEPLLLSSRIKILSHWSRDGRFVVYCDLDPKNKFDLWVLPMDGSEKERKAVPFLQTEFNELLAQLSPDSHWMAYTSDQSGRREVYVRAVPGRGRAMDHFGCRGTVPPLARRRQGTVLRGSGRKDDGRNSEGHSRAQACV